MFNKKIAAAMLLLGLVQNQCSAANVGKNSQFQIVKNVSFTIAGALGGVLSTLLVQKIASKDEKQKQGPDKPSDNDSDNNSDNNKINFQLGKPLFRIMFTDGREKCYIKSLDKRFDKLAKESELNKLLNSSKKDKNRKFSNFCKELNLSAKSHYQPRYFYEQLSDRVKKHYENNYRNNFSDVLENFDSYKLFYEVCETSEKDKLFLWVYGVDVFGQKLGIPYGSFDAEGDSRFNLIHHIKEFVKNNLKLKCVEALDVRDNVWLESQQFGRRAEGIEEYFTKKK